MSQQKQLTLQIHSAPKATLYLSVSWQPDQGKTFGYQVVRRLDDKHILAVGDPKGFDEMDLARISRVMRGTNGFLSVLPYRPKNPPKTSGFMVDELRQAIECQLPIAILCDKRIGAATEKRNESLVLKFPDKTEVPIPRSLAHFVKDFDFGVERSEEVRLAELTDFLDQCAKRNTDLPQYAFLVTRLQPDFKLPRQACVAAIEATTGLPCLWIDSTNYASNVDDTIERVRLLIQHSSFVVAEISLTDENPSFDNPSRAHEIGLATAFGKPVFPVSHDPRRHPYHGLVAAQVVWWSDESELFTNLSEKLNSERAAIGRHVYNWELSDVDNETKTKNPPAEFNNDAALAWTPPHDLQLPDYLSWTYAVSFGIIVFCLALSLKRIVGYDDTLDLAAVLAGVATFLFSSRLHDQFHKVLCSHSFLRWLIPLIAAIVLGATIIALRPASPVDETHNNTMHAEPPTARVVNRTISPAAR